MSKKPAPERITLTFDLLDLPTAQHRAGLAGLILQIDSMREEGNRMSPKLIPEIEKLTTTSATIAFTRGSMQGVFDDLYAAKFVEVVVATKWPGETKPKPGEFFLSTRDPKTGEVKPVKGFAYDVVQPLAPCLSKHLQEGTESPWLDLWRQMVWSITRGGNNVRSRSPFIDVAKRRPCGDGATAWAQLIDFDEKSAKSLSLTAPISGALMLGAQAVNAEAVPFSGRVDHNLLLHFWQVVVLTFVPQVVSKKDAKVERMGYVLAIPDVADLREFRDLFPEILGGLKADQARRIPTAAKVDLPDQAGLEVLKRLKEGVKEGRTQANKIGASERAGSFEKRLPSRGAGDRADRLGAVQSLASSRASSGWGTCVRAVESYHMFKLGNNVKLLSFSRVADRPGLVRQYAMIARTYRNPLFRAALMRALIRDQAWHSGMIELFAEYPYPFFIEGDDTPKYLPRYGRDARELLKGFYKDTQDMNAHETDYQSELKLLGIVIHRLVDGYVERRAEKKTAIKVATLTKAPVRDKDGEPLKRKSGEPLMLPVFPKEFREAQQRICSDAFLAIRSRHDQDFVEYFAGTICSVEHQLSHANYQFLVRVLMTSPDPDPVGEKRLCWEDVKAMAMIAFSACSFNVRSRDAETQGSPS